MKKILFLGLIVLAGYQLWGKVNHAEQDYEPDYDEPYVAVYGRDSCGFTQKMLRHLKSNGMNYSYFVVDEQEVANRLHSKMESSGISTRRYNLPVVDVNGMLSVRPDIQDVTQNYNY